MAFTGLREIAHADHLRTIFGMYADCNCLRFERRCAVDPDEDFSGSVKTDSLKNQRDIIADSQNGPSFLSETVSVDPVGVRCKMIAESG